MSETTAHELDSALAAAAACAAEFGDLPVPERAAMLHRVADTLDDARDEIVQLGERETHLPTPRLTGELARTTGQLRFLGDVIVDGAWRRATVDTADPSDPVLRPDVRSMHVPLGVALIFAAGNFPLAFSVAGGDTASALAAGSPVVLKAHPGHPELSELVGAVVKDVFGDAFWLVTGVDAARAAIVDPRVKVASFTGSVAGGRALFELATGRADPIPFHGELGSMNPVFVTPGAVRERGEEIADGYVASFSGSSGQLCTKPGLLFLPAGHGLEARVASGAGAVPAAPMLEERLAESHARTRASLLEAPGVRTLGDAPGGAVPATPTVLASTVAALANDSHLLEECFGPTSIIVEYDGEDELVAASRLIEGSLTATIHATEADEMLVARLASELRSRAGRLVWNGWPTGVRVTWAMQHGGPWPASTSSSHTSVGAEAVDRFTRPVAFQSTPQVHLPVELRDHNELGIMRRVNGVLTNADVSTGTVT